MKIIIEESIIKGSYNIFLVLSIIWVDKWYLMWIYCNIEIKFWCVLIKYIGKLKRVES